MHGECSFAFYMALYTKGIEYKIKKNFLKKKKGTKNPYTIVIYCSAGFNFYFIL